MIFEDPFLPPFASWIWKSSGPIARRLSALAVRRAAVMGRDVFRVVDCRLHWTQPATSSSGKELKNSDFHNLPLLELDSLLLLL